MAKGEQAGAIDAAIAASLEEHLAHPACFCSQRFVATSYRLVADASTLEAHCSRCQKNPRFGRSLAAASMMSAAVMSVSAASPAFACSVG